MEDVTDPAFRALCKRYGADRVYTEFVNADALVRDIASTTRKLTIHDAERPVAIQIYGREPESMAEAARIVETAKPDFIDINFGCPVKSPVKPASAGTKTTFFHALIRWVSILPPLRGGERRGSLLWNWLKPCKIAASKNSPSTAVRVRRCTEAKPTGPSLEKSKTPRAYTYLL